MIYSLLLVLFSTLFSTNVNNSIFNLSKNPEINSLGGIHILSNDIDGLFNQPIHFNNQKIKGNSFYSYSSHFNKTFDVFQFGYCILHTDNKNLSFGVIQKIITNNFQTNYAWEYNSEGPSFDEVDYMNISQFNDFEVGFLISSSHKTSLSSSINFKLKPSFHKIDKSTAYGLSLDFIYYRKINNIDFILGFEDIFSFKKWSSNTENYSMHAFSNISFNYKKIFLSIELDKDLNISFGSNYRLSNLVSLRAGYNKYKDLSFGIGLQSEILEFNYAYINTESNFINNFNQYSFTINLEGLKSFYKRLSI